MIVISDQDFQFNLRKYVMAEEDSGSPYIVLRGSVATAVRTALSGDTAVVRYVIGCGFGEYTAAVTLVDGKLRMGCQSFSKASTKVILGWLRGRRC